MVEEEELSEQPAGSERGALEVQPAGGDEALDLEQFD